MELPDTFEAAYRGLTIRMQKHQDGWVVNILDREQTVVARTVLTHDREVAEVEAMKLVDEYINSKIQSR